MKGLPEERAILLAQYIIQTSATVRDAGEKFNISKSTVHKDVTERLSRLNNKLYLEVAKVLNTNKCQRHIRGGEATRQKYKVDTLKHND